jgi:signal transduction histidine kinase
MKQRLRQKAEDLTILCVDDEEQLLSSIVKFCSKYFGRVIGAVNGKEAFDIYKSEKVDLILSDIVMPEMSGIDMLREIRKEDEEIPVLILSAFAETEFFIETTKLGIDGYILKPMDIRSMLVTFEKTVDKINLKKENELYQTNLEKKVQEEVAKRQKSEQMMLAQAKHAAMGEMIGMIAHQWRQPLSAITSTANALAIKIKLNKFEKELFLAQINNIINFTSHLSSTIDDFRNFFKSNKTLQNMTLESVIESSIHIVDATLKNKHIELQTDFRSNESFRSYPNELRQVVLNLIKNSEDAILENEILEPKILIQTYNEQDKKVIVIKDNAGGIPEKIFDDIFNPYFTTKESKDGTGLGLYMSKTIIEEHCSGTLEVCNEAFDEKDTRAGAKFVIVLRNSVKEMHT